MFIRTFTKEETKLISDICKSLKPYVTEVIISNGNIIQYDDQVQIIFSIKNILKVNNQFTWIISDVKTNYSLFDIFEDFTLKLDEDKSYFELIDTENNSMIIRYVEPSNISLDEDVNYDIIHSVKLSSQNLRKINKMIDMIKNITFDIQDMNNKLVMTTSSKSKTKKFSINLCETPKQLKGVNLRYLFVVFDVANKLLSEGNDIELQFLDNEGEIDLCLSVSENIKIIGRKLEKDISELTYHFETEEKEEQ